MRKNHRSPQTRLRENPVLPTPRDACSRMHPCATSLGSGIPLHLALARRRRRRQFGSASGAASGQPRPEQGCDAKTRPRIPLARTERPRDAR